MRNHQKFAYFTGSSLIKNIEEIFMLNFRAKKPISRRNTQNDKKITDYFWVVVHLGME